MRDSGATNQQAAVNRRDFVRAAGAVAAALTLGGFTESAGADGRRSRGRDDDRRDDDRQEGADRVKDFIREVKSARLFDLCPTWDENSPIASVNPPFAMSLNATHASTIGSFDGHLSFTSEIMQWSGQHGAPSIDAIGHIGRDGKLFGGVDAFAATSDVRGIGRSGVGAHLAMDHYATDLLVNRGVLLDVATFIQGDASPLPADFEITAQNLADTAHAQRTRLHRGDTVLIRTGWGQYFSANPGLYKGDNSPGPGVDGAKFLVRHGARVVGNDTLTFERRPPLNFVPQFEIFPVHMLLIADNGIHIVENFFLEELAAARQHEFLIVVPPLKVRGSTGSALRAFALLP
jgi:kynurenine formamidase